MVERIRRVYQEQNHLPEDSRICLCCIPKVQPPPWSNALEAVGLFPVAPKVAEVKEEPIQVGSPPPVVKEEEQGNSLDDPLGNWDISLDMAITSASAVPPEYCGERVSYLEEPGLQPNQIVAGPVVDEETHARVAAWVCSSSPQHGDDAMDLSPEQLSLHSEPGPNGGQRLADQTTVEDLEREGRWQEVISTLMQAAEQQIVGSVTSMEIRRWHRISLALNIIELELRDDKSK